MRVGAPRWLRASLETPSSSVKARPLTPPEAPAPVPVRESAFERALSRFKNYVVAAANVLLPGPALELFGLKQQRETAAAFVETAQLADVRGAHHARALDAERRSIVANTPGEKRAWEWRAFDHWLGAARNEPVRTHQDLDRAQQTARRLSAFATSPLERGVFDGIDLLLAGKLEDATAKWRQSGGRSRVAAKLIDGVEQLEALERLHALSKKSPEDVLGEAPRLAKDHPALALDVAASILKAEAALGRTSSPTARLDRALKTTLAHHPASAEVALRGRRALLELEHAIDSTAALSRARETAGDASFGEEVRFRARLFEASFAAKVGELDAAISAASRARADAASPADRALTAIMLAGLLVERGAGVLDFDHADAVLKNALFDLDWHGAGFWERAQRAVSKLGELTAKLFKGEPLDLSRPPDRDQSTLVEQLLLARDSIRNKDVRGSLIGDRAALMRLISVSTLARAADVPLARFVDPHAGGVENEAPTPGSLLSRTHRPRGLRANAELDAMLAQKQLQGTFGPGDRGQAASAFRRAFSRELVLDVFEDWKRPKRVVTSSFDETDRAFRESMRTIARGLSQPGEALALDRFWQLHPVSGPVFESYDRPLPKELLGAASFTPPDRALIARLAEVESAIAKTRATKPAIAARLESIGVQAELESFKVGSTPGVMINLARGEQRARIVRVGSLSFSGEHWRLFELGRERELDRYRRAKGMPYNRGRIAQIDGLKSLRQFIRVRGRDPATFAKKREELRELAALEMKARALLRELQTTGRAPRAIYLMVEGIDAAGKTTAGERIAGVFTSGGYAMEKESFRAPTDAERAEHWLARFDRHRPRAGVVFFADRSPLGDLAYQKDLGVHEHESRARELLAWERSMADEDILVLKLLFHPGDEEDGEDALHLPAQWRPLFTFGKRQARAEAARDLVAELEGAGKVVPDGLRAATSSSPTIADLASFHDGVEVQERFQRAADLSSGDTDNPWIAIASTDRHRGRKHALRALIAQLEKRLTLS